MANVQIFLDEEMEALVFKIKLERKFPVQKPKAKEASIAAPMGRIPHVFKLTPEQAKEVNELYVKHGTGPTSKGTQLLEQLKKEFQDRVKMMHELRSAAKIKVAVPAQRNTEASKQTIVRDALKLGLPLLLKAQFKK